MGKKAKEHRKKVAKRNAKLNEEKKKYQKNAMDFLMKLIGKEKEKGLFDGPVQPIPNSNEVLTTEQPTEAPSTDTPIFNGPQI